MGQINIIFLVASFASFFYSISITIKNSNKKSERSVDFLRLYLQVSQISNKEQKNGISFFLETLKNVSSSVIVDL